MSTDRLRTGPVVFRVLALLAAMTLALSGCARGGDVDDKSQRVDALFASLDEGVQPGAAVLVIQDGEILHQAGYGYANLDERTPITPATSFRLASVSKQFTAMAVVVLVEDGLLDYDDPVSRYLPALSAYDGVTVRHLLTHTGGLPDYYDTIDTAESIPTNADALRLLGGMGGPVFVPGSRFEYSNPGYEMLALLVEAVSGLEFAKFMQDRVFFPAGMRNALIPDYDSPLIANRAYGYSPKGDDFHEDDYDPLNGIVGSGGVYASLTDLYHWDQALYGEALVTQDAIDSVYTPMRLYDGTSTGYGFGWDIEEYRGHRRVRHGGSWVGFRTHIARYPDEHFTVVILANRGDLQPGEYIDPITDIYLP